MNIELRGGIKEGLGRVKDKRTKLNFEGVSVQWEKGEWEFNHPDLGIVKKPTFSILNPAHWEDLAQRLDRGETAAGMMMGAYGVFKKLDVPESTDVLFERVKKRSKDQNFVVLVHPADIHDVIDFDRLREPFKTKLRSSEERLKLYAGPQHVILPVKEGAVNDALVRQADKTIACFWVPGHFGFEGLVNAASKRMKDGMLGGGSLNFHGQEPCYDKEQLRKEMSRKPEWLEEIDFILFDEITEAEGIGRSHTMIRYTGDKPEAVRVGSLSVGTIIQATGHNIVLADGVKYASSKRDYSDENNTLVDQKVRRALQRVQRFRDSLR